MLRRLADSVYQHLLASFPPGDGVGRAELYGDEMPEPIAQYLTQVLNARLEAETLRLRQTSSPWFAMDHPDVAAAFGTLGEELAQHAQFPADEWPAALERATRNVMSYHTRPARTLLDFLFVRESDRHTPEGLDRKLSYFATYPYLPEVVQAYVQEHDPEDLGRDAISAFVDHVDERMRTGKDFEAWASLLRPLFDIAGRLPAYDGVVPVELLITFFRDKGVPRVEHQLERMHEMEGVDVMSLDELKRVVLDEPPAETRPAAPSFRHQRVVQPESAPPPVSSPQPETSQPELPPQREERAEPLRPVPTTGPVPLWQQFRKSPLASEPTAPRPPAGSRSNAGHPAGPPAEARPLWMRFSEQHPPSHESQGESDQPQPLIELF